MAADEDPRQKTVASRDGGITSQGSTLDGPSYQADNRHHLGAIGGSAPAAKAKEDEVEQAPPFHDPLGGMTEADKWGIKGLRYLMNNYPDFNALVSGIDYTNMGLDSALRSSEYVVQ